MVILGLGSNVGDRLAHLKESAQQLAAILQNMRTSRLLESEALLPAGAPAEWNQAYLNMAISGDTALSPQTLLEAVKNIEQNIGRVSRGAWGPREIDIDILAMDDVVMESANLSIPHSSLLERDFALLPLIDVAPHWQYPGAGKYRGWLAANIVTDKGFALNGQLRDMGLVL